MQSRASFDFEELRTKHFLNKFFEIEDIDEGNTKMLDVTSKKLGNFVTDQEIFDMVNHCETKLQRKQFPFSPMNLRDLIEKLVENQDNGKYVYLDMIPGFGKTNLAFYALSAILIDKHYEMKFKGIIDKNTISLVSYHDVSLLEQGLRDIQELGVLPYIRDRYSIEIKVVSTNAKDGYVDDGHYQNKYIPNSEWLCKPPSGSQKLTYIGEVDEYSSLVNYVVFHTHHSVWKKEGFFYPALKRGIDKAFYTIQMTDEPQKFMGARNATEGWVVSGNVINEETDQVTCNRYKNLALNNKFGVTGSLTTALRGQIIESPDDSVIVKDYSKPEDSFDIHSFNMVFDLFNENSVVTAFEKFFKNLVDVNVKNYNAWTQGSVEEWFQVGLGKIFPPIRSSLVTHKPVVKGGNHFNINMTLPLMIKALENLRDDESEKFSILQKGIVTPFIYDVSTDKDLGYLTWDLDWRTDVTRNEIQTLVDRKKFLILGSVFKYCEGYNNHDLYSVFVLRDSKSASSVRTPKGGDGTMFDIDGETVIEAKKYEHLVSTANLHNAVQTPMRVSRSNFGLGIKALENKSFTEAATQLSQSGMPHDEYHGAMRYLIRNNSNEIYMVDSKTTRLVKEKILKQYFLPEEKYIKMVKEFENNLNLSA